MLIHRNRRGEGLRRGTLRELRFAEVLFNFGLHGRYCAMGKKWLFGALLCGLVVGSSASRGEEGLDAPCPVDWRGIPVSEAVRELARRLSTPYILDSSVTDEMMARSVRFTAGHLNGRQAFRWTVRVAGLEAAFVEGTAMIAQPERLPLVWRKASAATNEGGQAETSPAAGAAAGQWQSAMAQKADLAWVDVPLSRVTRDISERFGIDVIFHPRIVADQPLIRLQGEQLGLAAVREALGTQLAVESQYDDGVLWVEPRDLAVSRPAAAASEGAGAAALAKGDPGSVLSRPIELRVESGKADDLGEALSRAAGIKCRVRVSSGAVLGPVAARGRLGEVLEAGRLVGGWEYKISPGDGTAGPILLIQVGGSGRSVP